MFHEAVLLELMSAYNKHGSTHLRNLSGHLRELKVHIGQIPIRTLTLRNDMDSDDLGEFSCIFFSY